MLPRSQKRSSKKRENTGDDDVTVDTDMDLGTDYEDLQRTESLVEYVSVMRERGPGLESWNEEPLSRQRSDNERSSDGVEKTAKIDRILDRILSTGDWDEDSTKKTRKKEDALLEARGKHNFVGYYL